MPTAPTSRYMAEAVLRNVLLTDAASLPGHHAVHFFEHPGTLSPKVSLEIAFRDRVHFFAADLRLFAEIEHRRGTHAAAVWLVDVARALIQRAHFLLAYERGGYC